MKTPVSSFPGALYALRESAEDLVMLAYSIEEAAGQLGVCKRLVRELVKENRVRSVKIGRRIVIPHVELERLLAPPPEITESEVAQIV